MYDKLWTVLEEAGKLWTLLQTLNTHSFHPHESQSAYLLHMFSFLYRLPSLICAVPICVGAVWCSATILTAWLVCSQQQKKLTRYLCKSLKLSSFSVFMVLCKDWAYLTLWWTYSLSKADAASHTKTAGDLHQLPHTITGKKQVKKMDEHNLDCSDWHCSTIWFSLQEWSRDSQGGTVDNNT